MNSAERPAIPPTWRAFYFVQSDLTLSPALMRLFNWEHSARARRSTLSPAWWARFDEDLRVSSLDIVEAIMSIEDEFGIEISDSDADALHTVGHLVVLVRATLLPSAASTGMHVKDGAGVE